MTDLESEKEDLFLNKEWRRTFKFIVVLYKVTNFIKDKILQEKLRTAVLKFFADSSFSSKNKVLISDLYNLRNLLVLSFKVSLSGKVNVEELVRIINSYLEVLRKEPGSFKKSTKAEKINKVLAQKREKKEFKLGPRHIKILDFIKEKGSVLADEVLALLPDVSMRTLRRDIEKLLDMKFIDKEKYGRKIYFVTHVTNINQGENLAQIKEKLNDNDLRSDKE